MHNSAVHNCEQGAKEEFDWAGYLLDGEDVPRHYMDSPVCRCLL